MKTGKTDFSTLLTAVKETRKEQPKKTEKVLTELTATAKVKPIASKTKGKSSDPTYTKALAYIKEDTYKKVRTKLINSKDKKDYSDLTQELLEKWLAE
jgi:hypothetical protein